MRYLITGGCGFIGSNLAKEVLKRGEELFVLDNLYRHGSAVNLKQLQSTGEFEYFPYDIRSKSAVEEAVRHARPDYVFHLSGQVAMTTSIQNPRLDFEVNAQGMLNVLEAVRQYAPEAVVLFSSTNKVYGDFEYLHFKELESRYACEEYPDGFPESITLDFHSPYGCSKGCADQYMLDFHRIYGLKTIVFRHSSMYGINQYATFDQGWIGWFCQQALELKRDPGRPCFTIAGTGKQVRDVLFGDDVVSLYFKAKDVGSAFGEVFNIGGGMENSLSLLELFSILEKKLNIHMVYEQMPWRESDQKVFVASLDKVRRIIGWQPSISADEGIDIMLAWLSNQTQA